MRSPLWFFGLFGLFGLLGACASRPAAEKEQVSGAYEALSHFGASRAYPERDIPPARYTRGYEFSKRNLRPDSRVRQAPLPGTEPLKLDRATRPVWRPIGPLNGGGRTLTLAFDPTNPNTLWAGSAAGGLWRSTTAGIGAEAWERVDTGHPVLGVSSIAFAPDDPGVMYLGTGEVYNHLDAGNQAADRATRGSYGIGILKSTDGGATWTKSLDWSYNQRQGVWAVRVDPTNANIVWAATTEGVYRSIDAGGSWTPSLSVVMAMDLVIHPTTPDTVLVGCGNLSSPGRGLYRTTNGGTSWSQVTGGGVPADYAGKVQFGVTADDPDVVYASIGNGFSTGSGNFTWLLFSNDFGASFVLRSTTDYSRYQGWYAHDVAVSPFDLNLLVCVGIDAWRSTSGGTSLLRESDWRFGFTGQLPAGGPEGSADYSHADHHAALFHPTDPNVVYVANDGGVFRSDDQGLTWAGANGGYQSQQFYNGSQSYATDPALAIGGLQDNNTAIYRGTGEWQRGVLGGDGGWAALDPVDPDIVYATAQGLFVGRSDDGGDVFNDISPPGLGGPLAFICPLILAPGDRTRLYGGTSYFFRSTNSGSGWTTGNNGNPIDGNPLLVMDVSSTNADLVYAATAPFSGRMRVYRTQNGGTSFTEITGTLPDRYPGDLFVDTNDDATVYLTLSGFGTSHVFRSRNSGAGWTDIDGGRLPDVPTSAVVVDPDFPEHVYVGNDLGVYFSRDGGAHWEQLHRGLPEAVLVLDLNVSPVNRKLRAFTHGLGVYEVDLIGDTGLTPRQAPARSVDVR